MGNCSIFEQNFGIAIRSPYRRVRYYFISKDLIIKILVDFVTVFFHIFLLILRIGLNDAPYT